MTLQEIADAVVEASNYRKEEEVIADVIHLIRGSEKQALILAQDVVDEMGYRINREIL